MSEHNVRTIINKPEDRKPIEWEWNDRSYKEYQKYTKDEIKIPDKLTFCQERIFVAKADPTGKYTPIRTVTKIVRCKAVDWDDKYHKEKEYLYWFETWTGKDFQGRTIPPVTDSIFGRYDEIVMENVIDKYGDYAGQRMVRPREKYYVPFSKEEVDKIIARSDNTDKTNINFTFKGPTFRNDAFNYEQFANYPFELMIEAMSIKGGPRMFEYYQKQEVKERQERFKKYSQVT